MGYIEEIQRQKANEAKAQAFDSMQLQNKVNQIADQAHTAGIDDGLAAAMRKAEAQKQEQMYQRDNGNDVQMIREATQILGRPPRDEKDIQEAYRYKQLMQMGINKNENGLASQAIN